MVDKKEVFEYLDDLRDSGVTNMFGSPAYVERDFKVTRKESHQLVSEWMEMKSKEAK
jgi:hypothetical protein